MPELGTVSKLFLWLLAEACCRRRSYCLISKYPCGFDPETVYIPDDSQWALLTINKKCTGAQFDV